MSTGSTRRYPGLTSTSHRSRGGGCAGDEEDNGDGDYVNRDEVNWDVLQRRAATRSGETRRGVAHTLAGYDWVVGGSDVAVVGWFRSGVRSWALHLYPYYDYVLPCERYELANISKDEREIRPKEVRSKRIEGGLFPRISAREGT